MHQRGPCVGWFGLQLVTVLRSAWTFRRWSLMGTLNHGSCALWAIRTLLSLCFLESTGWIDLLNWHQTMMADSHLCACSLLSLHSDVASSGSGRCYSGVCKELALEQNRRPLTSGATDHFVSDYSTSVQAQSKDGANSSPESTAMSCVWVLLTANCTQSPGHSTVVVYYASCWWSSRDHCLPKGLRYFKGTRL